MLEHVCKSVAAWNRRTAQPVSVHVNLSSKFFQRRDTPQIIERVLQRFQLDGTLLCLEITETAVISDAEATPVSEILANPAGFDGMEVKVTGEIGKECPTGCWFELRDNGSSLHIDIAPYGLAIPQKQGSPVTVEGTVKFTDSRLMLVGKGVEIR